MLLSSFPVLSVQILAARWENHFLAPVFNRLDLQCTLVWENVVMVTKGFVNMVTVVDLRVMVTHFYSIELW